MKKEILTTILIVLAITVSLGMMTGCQTPGKVVSEKESEKCPMCKTQTVTTAVEGLTYKKHICPECKEVSTIPAEAPMSLQDYVDEGQQTIHVCEHCEAAVSKCPLCRNK